MTNTIVIDFLQQQLRDTTFSYKINANEQPLVYTSGVDNVTKTFVGSNIHNRGKIAAFYTDLALQLSDIGSFNGNVRDMAILNDGRIAVVGQFTQYTYGGNNYNSHDIIILNSNYSVNHTFNQGAVGDIVCVTTQSNASNKIYIGGAFSSFQGTACNNLCRLNENFSVDTTFTTAIMSAGSNKGFNSTVFSVYSNTSYVLVGGDFTNFNNNNRNKIVRLNTNGTLDNSFNIGTGFNGAVKCIIPLGEQVYISGSFTTYKGATANRFIAVKWANAAVHTPFNIGVGFDGDVNTFDIVSISNTACFICGGTFNNYKSVPAAKICAITTTTAARYSGFNMGTGFNNTVNSVISNPYLVGNIFVGGAFTSYNGTTCNRLAKLSGTGALMASGNLDATVNVICRSHIAGLTLVGGAFSTATYGAVPVQSQTTIPLGATLTDTIANTLTNLQAYNVHASISYAIVGETIEVYYEYDETLENTLSNVQNITDYLIITAEGFSQIIAFNNERMILAGKDNPYYIRYAAPAESFDYIVLDLYVWSGENWTPSVPTHPLTLYKTSAANSFIYVDVQPYIKSHLEPRFNESWFTNIIFSVDTTLVTVDDDSYTADMTYYPLSEVNTYAECVWVKWTIRSYKRNGNAGYLSETIESDLHFATLGYGYHHQGVNPHPPSNVLINPVDKFSTENTTNYRAVISGTATNTNKIILRDIEPTNNVICTHRDRDWQIVYRNQCGLWDSMLFNRAWKNEVEISSDSYQFYQERPDFYNIYEATTRNSNIRAKEMWTLNTTLMNEAQNKYIEELFASDRWFLMNESENLIYPVILTEKNFVRKSRLNDKAEINWTLKFERANNKINDIR